MSIRKESATTWGREFASLAGDFNEEQAITATAEGLEIDYDIIPWAEIDEARKHLTDAPRVAIKARNEALVTSLQKAKWGESFIAQPAYKQEQREKTTLARQLVDNAAKVREGK